MIQDIVTPVTSAVDQLLGRASGPMHARLIMQPVMASFLAVRAGLRDAREGNPAFFWSVLTNKEERRLMLQSGWKDLSKIFAIAMILDTVYQIIALHEFSLLQTLIVAIAVAVVPYTIVRGPANRIARAVKPASKPAEVS
jgi:hypothetical protein